VERRVAAGVNIGRKASPPQGPYRPKGGCDLYIPMKNECAGLRELVCSANGKCPFFKTKERALADRLKSIQRRKRVGFPISNTEAQMLLEAVKLPDAKEQ
jgi:hypothetical protein